MQRPTKKIIEDDEKSEEEWESEKELNQENLKNAMQKTEFKNSDRMANIVYNMILKNKINANNAFEVPLLNIKDMSDFGKFDGGSWKNLSTALETDAKLYGFRVDSVFNEVYKVLGGLNRGLKDDGQNIKEEKIENADIGDIDNINQSPLKKRKIPQGSQQTKFLENNVDHLNFQFSDLEFEVDPLLEKTSAKFDDGGSLGLLTNSLMIDKNLSFKLMTFEMEKEEMEKECYSNKTMENPKFYYSSRFQLHDCKTKLNFLKSLCPEIKDIINQIKSNTDFSQSKSKLNFSQFTDLNFSQINTFLCDDSYQETMESIFDNNSDHFSLKEGLKSAYSSLKHSSIYENSYADGIIENFQSKSFENSKVNLSLCDFDDQQMGNGNAKFFEFYQENEKNNYWLGPELLRTKKTNLLKSKLDKKKAENEATEKLAPKINFASEAKPNYLRESPLNLNNFFEDKLIEQMDPIKHSFLLPMDLHLEASKLTTLLGRSFFSNNLNTDLNIEFDKSYIEPETQIFEEVAIDENSNTGNLRLKPMPIIEVKTKVWSKIDSNQNGLETSFLFLAKKIPEIVPDKSKICSIQTLFLSILHLANEHNLILENSEDQNVGFTIKACKRVCIT